MCYLKGFPIEYNSDLTLKLNKVVEKTYGLSFSRLEKIGKSISPNENHKLHEITKDGYTWRVRLTYQTNDNTRIAVLFPWHQYMKGNTRILEKPIKVFSDKETSKENMKKFIDELTEKLINFSK